MALRKQLSDVLQKLSDLTLQADTYRAWRKTIIDKVVAGDETYLRPATYDAVLSTLFPDMLRGIATG